MQEVVRKLTPTTRRLTAIVVLLALSPIAAAASADWQDLEAIRESASRFLTERIGQQSGETRVEAGFLDPRLKLPACSESLTPFLNTGTRINRTTTVGVRCTGERRWKVYVPVSVVTESKVVVAARHLPKGTLITPDAVRLERRDVTRNRSGYYRSIEAAVGQRVAQSILEGRMLAPGLVEADDVIRRGQSVTLMVETGGMRINMSGKALIDGAIGQRIQVENLSSGRVVEGIVRSREHVEVIVARQGNNFFSSGAKASAPVADTRFQQQ
jgi:flagella basal body P-ring formation protein FlgA